MYTFLERKEIIHLIGLFWDFFFIPLFLLLNNLTLKFRWLEVLESAAQNQYLIKSDD